jgi:hypothetical protein
MLSVLSSVLDGVLSIPYLIAGILIDAINGWLGLFAAVAAAAIAVLPSFPALPELPGEWGAAVSFFLPIGTMLGIFSAFVTAWVLWWGISQALRWVKVIG